MKPKPGYKFMVAQANMMAKEDAKKAQLRKLQALKKKSEEKGKNIGKKVDSFGRKRLKKPKVFKKANKFLTGKRITVRLSGG